MLKRLSRLLHSDGSSTEDAIEIKEKRVDGILIGYFGSANGKTIFLDMAMLEFYPSNLIKPYLMSWDGFPKDKKFIQEIFLTEITVDISEQEVIKLMKPRLLDTWASR